VYLRRFYIYLFIYELSFVRYNVRAIPTVNKTMVNKIQLLDIIKKI